MEKQLGVLGNRRVIVVRRGFARDYAVECYTLTRKASTPRAANEKRTVVKTEGGTLRMVTVPQVAPPPRVAAIKKPVPPKGDTDRYSFLPLHRYMLGLAQGAMA